MLIRVILTLFLSNFAAQAFADRAERFIAKLDGNGDGVISVEEFHPSRGNPGEKMIKHADEDGDGAVSLNELQAAQEKRKQKMQERASERESRMGEMFASADANADGMLTAEEMRLHAFNRMDSNGDGVLDGTEVKPPRHHKKNKPMQGQ